MDLFGNETPPPASSGKCDHLNVEYTLPCFAHLKVRSTWKPGEDSVKETERKITWSGGVQGRCDDCGKQLFYTASNMPKFVTRRLKRVTIPEVIQSPILGR